MRILHRFNLLFRLSPAIHQRHLGLLGLPIIIEDFDEIDGRDARLRLRRNDTAKGHGPDQSCQRKEFFHKHRKPKSRRVANLFSWRDTGSDSKWEKTFSHQPITASSGRIAPDWSGPRSP